jgi:hypothetical protein
MPFVAVKKAVVFTLSGKWISKHFDDLVYLFGTCGDCTK